MEDVIFLITLVGDKVHNGTSIIGYTDSNDKSVVASYIKDRFKLNLGEQLLNRYSYQNGIHWEYETDNANVFVHIDVIDKIE